MLTIGKLSVTPARLEYYDAQVAAGAEDYYAGRGESPGRWRGHGAELLGLTARGPVAREEFMAVMHGRHPIGGAVLRPMDARSTVAGFDLTFSAPKSVSVLFAVADDDTARELLAAHEEAVSVALGYLERVACFTRRGQDGVDRLRGDGFVAAAYRHRMSRAGDPQLHTHVVVANLTRAEGRFTALDGRALYEHKSAGGAVYRAALRARVRERLTWASWHGVGRGLFELDGIPEPVLRHFSQRRVEIEERAFELAGVAASELSRERKQGIALATRRVKCYGVDGATWREQARARSSEHGFGADELAVLKGRGQGLAEDPDLARAAARLSGANGLTARHNTFHRRHALAELAGTFSQGVTLAELEATVDRYLKDNTVVQLRAPSRGEERYSTRELIARERDIIESAARRRDENTGVLDPGAVETAIAEYQPELTDEQAAAVRQIAASGHGFDVVTALAGTGKTTMLGALDGAYRRAGWKVVGATPTARAARQLRDIAGIDADTTHSHLGRLARSGGIDANTILIIDEAGMAPTRCTSMLITHAEQVGAKVIAIGDPGQLISVEAGGWLGAVAARAPGPELRTVMRQSDVDEQRALEALHDGEPDLYLAHKSGAIAVHGTEADALRAVRDAWHSARGEHGPRGAVMIARDNLTRERLNHAARAVLKADGVLLELIGVYIGGREYCPGDRVVARRNDYENDIDNGSLGTVVAVDERSCRLTVQTDDGDLRVLDHTYVADYVEHAYALTAHAAQGATVEWAGVIGRPGDFAREWAYTALSRARGPTQLHLIGEAAEQLREREEYAPSEPVLEPTQTVQALAAAMRRSEAEPLAIEQIVHVAQPQRQPRAEPEQLAGLAHLRHRQTSRRVPSLKL